MKISCLKNNLVNGINIVMKAVSNKSTLPILECILVEAAEGRIKLTANDMELGIETYVDGTIKENGKIAIEAKLFSDIIKRLPDSEVSIDSSNDSGKALIRCEKSKFDILVKSGEDFSYLPEVEKNKKITLSQFTLKEVIRQTIFSISDNESNKLMSGELFQVENNKLKVASLDGHRISIRNVFLKESNDDIKVVVPGKSLADVNKILTGGIEDDINIYFTDKHVLFEFDDTKIVSRLLEGEYYKIDQMLSTDYETKIDINKKELLDCIDRASLLIKESDKKPIIINVKEQSLYLKIDSIMGSMDEDIDILKEGKDIIIGFNPRFIMDALKVIDDETISIYLVNSKSPCFIRDENNSYIYLILPVNISSAS